ncbi:hypothetical protein [Massilia sp. NR 4-1]|uniref:hypothetical protein n=1 Tax=Massilia sp. NR 4-1 TaxID=1678028 RepID=UPI00067D6AC9|nr:hypothetical protein [Massilia sp. NR 4-1]AKU22907.1 hypothetical protein ACZ75_16975 [Massilia sp. NR 4-1]
MSGSIRRAKREVADVPEPKRPDRRLDQLLHVRKQRLGRLERERGTAREAWRSCRQSLRECKLRKREALQQAVQFWQEARASFLGMTITSGQFHVAKARYERMKEDAAQLNLRCQETVRRCRAAGTRYFAANEEVQRAQRQQEKLGILRDEMRALSLQNAEGG